MNKSGYEPLNFLIDKLTNSIENTSTGEVFDTEIVRLTVKDISQIKKPYWQFDWTKEIKDKTKEVYKLTTVNNPTIIQGLISIEDNQDHVFMHLIESAPFNKGKTKMYAGIPGNLVAFACKLSFQRGHEGNVSFLSKTKLIEHYEKTLGAFHFGGRVMIIETKAALNRDRLRQRCGDIEGVFQNR